MPEVIAKGEEEMDFKEEKYEEGFEFEGPEEK